VRAVRPRRGRPRKFTSPSRAVTLTLPEPVIAALEAVDHDLSRAVVRIAQPEMAKVPHPAAEVATFGRYGVIVVNPTRTLEQRTGVLLIPLSDGRALIAFDESMNIDRLELAIRDELDDRNLPQEDARVFQAIRELLKEARHSDEVKLRQRNIIVLEHVHASDKSK
jgi:cobalamin biosynthesis protein CbiG